MCGNVGKKKPSRMGAIGGSGDVMAEEVSSSPEHFDTATVRSRRGSMEDFREWCLRSRLWKKEFTDGDKKK
jgi:hypothetical protein